MLIGSSSYPSIEHFTSGQEGSSNAVVEGLLYDGRVCVCPLNPEAVTFREGGGG